MEKTHVALVHEETHLVKSSYSAPLRLRQT